jgi:hypothetical protein
MKVANCLVAERFASAGDLLLHRWHGQFWEWKTSHWIGVEDAELRSTAYKYAENAVYTKVTKNGAELVP